MKPPSSPLGGLPTRDLLSRCAQGILLLLLIPRLGATGAAIAYSVSMCGMYGAFAWMALRELALLKANRESP